LAVPARGGQLDLRVETNIMIDGFRVDQIVVPEWITYTRTVDGYRITVTVNDTPSTRTGAVTVIVRDLSASFDVIQWGVPITGTRVIENFGRRTYVDVFGSETTTLIECVSPSSTRRPIWHFVHIEADIYAIRNDTTGRYFTATATGANLRHEARISGIGLDYSERQQWQLIAQDDGSFRIRSVSNPTLYITEQFTTDPHLSPNFLTLSTLNTSHNRQKWWIGHIWHQAPDYGNWVGFWEGTINIRIVSVRPETHPADFNFEQRMKYARNVWGSALGITFNDVTAPNDANINVYGGPREDVRRELRRPAFPDTWHGVAHIPSARREVVGAIQAGGAIRTVNRFFGTGSGLGYYHMAIFSDNRGNVNFATMTAIHELGHMLGYGGHSPNSNDVMTDTTSFLAEFFPWLPWVSPNETLNPAEIEHLRQIYQMFRN